MKNATEIAAAILAQGKGATDKQAALIGRKLAAMLARQERHGVPMAAALLEEWIHSSATKAGASQNISLMLDYHGSIRG